MEIEEEKIQFSKRRVFSYSLEQHNSKETRELGEVPQRKHSLRKSNSKIYHCKHLSIDSSENSHCLTDSNSGIEDEYDLNNRPAAPFTDLKISYTPNNQDIADWLDENVDSEAICYQLNLKSQELVGEEALKNLKEELKELNDSSLTLGERLYSILFNFSGVSKDLPSLSMISFCNRLRLTYINRGFQQTNVNMILDHYNDLIACANSYSDFLNVLVTKSRTELNTIESKIRLMTTEFNCFQHCERTMDAVLPVGILSKLKVAQIAMNHTIDEAKTVLHYQEKQIHQDTLHHLNPHILANNAAAFKKIAEHLYSLNHRKYEDLMPLLSEL